MNTISNSRLASLSEPVRAALDRMRGDSVVQRIWSRDHTLWSPDPAEIGNRMGWLDSPEAMVPGIREIDPVVEAVRESGCTHALLLGMGGSSLAPEVLRNIFGFAPGHPDLAVLDSTDPAAVLGQARRLDPSRTLFIAATKSGGTVETISFVKYFYNVLHDAVGPGKTGDRFIAITDPGSGLEELARSLDFRHLFLNDPDIGGRYSALSFFGTAPRPSRRHRRRAPVGEGARSSRTVPARGGQPRSPPRRRHRLRRPRRPRQADPGRFSRHRSAGSLDRTADRREHRQAGQGDPPGRRRSPPGPGALFRRQAVRAGAAGRGLRPRRPAGSPCRRRQPGDHPRHRRCLRRRRAVRHLGGRHRRRRPPARDQPVRPAGRRGGQAAGRGK